MAREALLITDDIVAMLRGQFSKTYVRDVITHRPDFPRPMMIGRTRFWSEEEISRWLKSRKNT